MRKLSCLATLFTSGYTVYIKLNVSLAPLFFRRLYLFSAVLVAALLSLIVVELLVVVMGGSP